MLLEKFCAVPILLECSTLCSPARTGKTMSGRRIPSSAPPPNTGLGIPFHTAPHFGPLMAPSSEVSCHLVSIPCQLAVLLSRRARTRHTRCEPPRKGLLRRHFCDWSCVLHGHKGWTPRGGSVEIGTMPRDSRRLPLRLSPSGRAASEAV